MTTVFISSTVKDLRAYREAAKDVVLRLGWHPVMVNEHELIAAGMPLDECMKKAYRCDLFVLLAGYRYGFVPSQRQGGDGERSIVRYELFAWREKLKEEGGYYPVVFTAYHPTLCCGEGEGSEHADSQVRFRAALERNYEKHDFDFVPDGQEAQRLALLEFSAKLQTQLADLKAEMINDENEELAKQAERAERKMRRAQRERERAKGERDVFAVTALGATATFLAWVARKK